MARQTTQSFDAFAETYDRLASLSGGTIRSSIEGLLPEKGARAVDLGCGTGHHAAMLADRFDEVLGVDISMPMLDIARARRGRPNVRYELRDLRDVSPEQDGNFDLVFSAFTLHHVPDLDEALVRIRSLLASGGRAVLLDNVSEKPAVPGWWFKREAVRRFIGDLRGRRRPWREAIELMRLQMHPAWLNHVTTDRFLSPEEFRRRSSEIFPGAQFIDLYRSCVLTWQVS
jgi:ubiquinone/menaquinone biosynthesis C-methylase UbiE